MRFGQNPARAGSGARELGDKRVLDAKRELDAKADEALSAARSMPAGPEKNEAMKLAGLLRREADAWGISFAKRGRPPK